MANQVKQTAEVKPNQDPAAVLQARIDALEQRIAALEALQAIALDEVTSAICEAARRMSFNIEPLLLVQKSPAQADK